MSFSLFCSARAVASSACISMLFLGAAVHAQTTSTMLGHAADQTGALIPNVSISVKNTATGYTREVLTDTSGNYILPQLPTGPYDATATVQGFQTRIVTGVTLSLDQNLRVDFALTPGEVRQAITVSGDTVAQIETHSSTLSTAIEQKRILDLPLNGRDPASLLSLIPGVSTLSVPTTPGISGDTATINGTNASARSS